MPCMLSSLAIEHAQRAGFRKLWLESDSTLICQAFSSAEVVSLDSFREVEKMYATMCSHGFQSFSYFQGRK